MFVSSVLYGSSVAARSVTYNEQFWKPFISDFISPNGKLLFFSKSHPDTCPYTIYTRPIFSPFRTLRENSAMERDYLMEFFFLLFDKDQKNGTIWFNAYAIHNTKLKN